MSEERRIYTWQDIERLMKWKFDLWQIDFIEANEPYLLLRCGRKAGKTAAIAGKIALDMLNLDFAHTHGICIVGNGLKGAKDILFTVRTILQGFGYMFGRDMNNLDEPYGTVCYLRLQNGNSCVAHPAGNTGDVIRPYSFYKLIRDEDAYIPNIDTAVDACLAAHGVQEIRSSTPNGRSGSFFESAVSGRYRMWHARTIDAKHHDYRAFLKIQKQKMTKAEYAQEYDADFTTLADGIFDPQLIGACTGRELRWLEIEKNAQLLFIGADFAAMGQDKNVFALAFFDGERIHVRIVTLETKTRTTQVAGHLTHLFNSYPQSKYVITDSGGLGEGPTDILTENLGKRKVIGIKNQELYDQKFMKYHLYMNLLRLLEQGKIVLDDDPGITRSLIGVQFKYSKQGKLLIGGRDTHAAEAIVRAVFPFMKRKWKKMDKHFFCAPHNEKDSFIQERGNYIIGN